MSSRSFPRGTSLALAGAFAAAGIAAAQAGGDADPAAPPLERVIRHFDFEEAEGALIEFPNHFKRNVAEDRGFPRFGRMWLTTSAAAGGRWSFGFELDGGSLSAEIPTGVVPILPLADYVVTARVRTTGLSHAAARVVARLHDGDGRPIEATRVKSAPLRTAGRWETVSLLVRGDDEDAVDLVVELQVVQPPHTTDGAVPRPRLEDVAGRAWFDDVIIMHLPRIELSSDAANNVLPAPGRIALGILVRDLADEELGARLRVLDVHGRVVTEESFRAPRGRRQVWRNYRIERAGWYRAELTVHGDRGVVDREHLDFAVLPIDRRRATRSRALGVHVPLGGVRAVERTPDLVDALNVGAAVVDVWSEPASTAERERERAEALHRTIEGLLKTDVEVTFVLGRVPDALARELGIDRVQVLEVFERDPGLWRDELDALFLDFGLRVARWQVGGVDRPVAFWRTDLPQATGAARSALARFIPDPTIVVPFTADQEIGAAPADHAVNVLVPHQVAPTALPDYAAPWLESDRDVMVTFEPAPTELYAPHLRLVDLLLRTLHAWRAGVPRLVIPAPWSLDRGGRVQPHPEFAAWRGLADALDGRRFVGELPLADGIECWMMEGRTPRDGALVAWSTRWPSGEIAPAAAALTLGAGPVRLVDAFGNTRTIEPVAGVHEVPVGAMPVFIEGIDLALARFRAGFAIEPAFVPARHRLQTAEIVLRNPWDVAISGSLLLRDSPQCRVTPRRHQFIIPPGEETRLPIEILCERSVVAGSRPLEAIVHLNADREHRLRLHAGIEIGWENVEVRASWRLGVSARTGQRELVITQHITNHGDEVVNLDAFVIAPGVRHNRRPVPALMPGVTAVRSFRVPGDPGELGGRRIRFGVSERDGIAQLNQVMRIPPFPTLPGGGRRAAVDGDEREP